MKLPTEIIKAETKNPRILVIFGKPKCGKTHLISMLRDNLLIDLEEGSHSVDALKIRIRTYDELEELYNSLVEAKNKLPNGEYPYTYITLDTATALEEMILPLAKKMYKQTPMSKNFTGSDVRMLPKGAGYLYIRNAYLLILNMFRGITKHLILLGHTKDKMINNKGTELSENALDLSGKLERLVCAGADAVGFLSRKKNLNILSFKGGDDFIIEARTAHLRGKEIILGESTGEGESMELTAHWDKIFKPEL